LTLFIQLSLTVNTQSSDVSCGLRRKLSEHPLVRLKILTLTQTTLTLNDHPSYILLYHEINFEPRR